MKPTTAPTLLHLDASPRGARSHSRKLGEEFLASWRAAHPGGRVVARDLGREPPPFVTEAWVEGAFAPVDTHSPAAREALAASNRYVDELLAAEQLVITTPTYNFSLPATLKAWIDQVVRFGRTFTADASGYRGLAKNKRAIIIVASSGDYRPGTPASALNNVEHYLRFILGFIGITDVQFVYAHSLNAEPARAAALAEAQTTLNALAA